MDSREGHTREQDTTPSLLLLVSVKSTFGTSLLFVHYKIIQPRKKLISVSSDYLCELRLRNLLFFL